jgi:hypothetical protein
MDDIDSVVAGVLRVPNRRGEPAPRRHRHLRLADPDRPVSPGDDVEVQFEASGTLQLAFCQ